MAAPQVVQIQELSQSAVVVDSAYRLNAAESPTNMSGRLLGALRGAKRMHHQSISWAQSMYAHNRESMLIRLEIDGYTPGPGLDPVLYCFMTPYYMFTSPDGTDGSTPFPTSVDQSYAADLEAALNAPLYFSAPNVMSVAVTGATFTVTYAKSLGFVVSCDADFSIAQESTWLQKAQAVHGFGEFIGPGAGIKYRSPTEAGFTTIIQSATTPNLIPSRFIGIACQELAQRRQLSSFSNVQSPAFGSAEVNVFSTSYADNGAWATKSTPSDPTVINMQHDDSIQEVNITMWNNATEQVNAQNPWPYLITRFLTAAEARTIAAKVRAAQVTNILVHIWSRGVANLLGSGALANFPPIENSVLCKPDEMMHKFLIQSYAA